MNGLEGFDDPVNRLKLEGAREMAVATACAIDRPLCIMSCVLESLLSRVDPGGPEHDELRLALEQVYRIGELTKRINSVWRYESKEGIQGSRIIDIDKAVAPCVLGDRIVYGEEHWPIRKADTGCASLP